MYINIPNYGQFTIKNIVFDYNGTIAENGYPLDVIKDLSQLDFNIYIYTGDTFSCAADHLKEFQVTITNTAEDKLQAIKKLGSQQTIAIGNGNIDHLMLKEAAIGVAVIGKEGASSKAIQSADIIVTNINHILDMIKTPKKLIATLKE